MYLTLLFILSGTNTGDFYYGHDHLYSPTVLFGLNDQQSWVPLERYEYDVYGTCRILTSGYSVLTSSQYGNPYYFTGRELDSLDSNGLKVMYYRARSYDPQAGRFLQRDPLGVDPANQGENLFNISLLYSEGMVLYEYAKSAPLNYIDPQGLNGLYPIPITEPDPNKKRVLKDFMNWFIKEASKGHWWEGLLPKCPLKLKFTCEGIPINPDPSKWHNPQTPNPAERRLHPGPDNTDIPYSMRSITIDKHSNQCTYNLEGDLYLYPPAAGTVDWIAPVSYGHMVNDVYPIHWAVYLDYGINMKVFCGPSTPAPPGPWMGLYYLVRPLYKESSVSENQ